MMLCQTKERDEDVLLAFVHRKNSDVYFVY